MAIHPVYRHMGVVLARATTDPGDLELPGGECLSNGQVDPEAGRAWLARIWSRSDVAAAVRFASPALAEQVDRLLTAEQGDIRQVRRTVLAIAAYLLRWRGRSTPFGLFAGVVRASVSGNAVANFGSGHRVVVRADAQWLAALIDALEHHQELQSRLTVTVNNAGFSRGNRFVVPARVRGSATGVGQMAENSVRLSGPVRAVLVVAALPVTIGELAEDLRSRFSAATLQKIIFMLSGLVEQGVLLTCLRPPTTAVQPLAHLVETLRSVGGLEIPGIACLIAELDAIHERTLRHNRCTQPDKAEWIRAEVTERMVALCDTAGPVLTADVALDAEITIAEAVLREAEAATTAMLRLSAQPFGATYWKEFQYRFRCRYGPGALVGVRELVADSGLGFPAGYLDAPRGRSTYAVSGRDQVIMALVQQAAVDGRAEIELTEPLIRALTVGDPAEVIPPSRVEIGFEVQADSTEEIQRGRFRLWVTAAPRPESSMAGRFAHLLSEQDQQRLAATYSVTDGDAAAVQLSFAPRRRDNETIVRAPLMLPRLISISEYPDASADLISVDDLAVTTDATQMYLVQISTGARVVPRVVNALEATLRTPQLARFLSEVASARHAVYGAFDFGVARDLPHLPRVRFGRTVLAPARWMLSTDIAQADSSMPEWEKALDGWRERWRVPPSILLCQGELRLPLDLEHAFHRRLLRTRLERAGKVEICESPGDGTAGWAGRPCELLVPMLTEERAPRRRLPSRLSEPSSPQPPGNSEVLHAQLLGNPGRFNEIITGQLPGLIQSLGEPLWWFRRNRDTTRPDADEHLALFIRLAHSENYGQAAALVSKWAAHLQGAGLLAHLSLDGYQFQPGRWGTGVAASAAEQVFAADSKAAIAQMTMAAISGIPSQAIAAASMTDLAANAALDPHTGLCGTVDQLKQETGKLEPSLRDQTLTLTDPDDGIAALRRAGGTGVAASWQARAAALIAWRDVLADQRDLASVLPSLLHDHHVRAIGVDPDVERVTNRLVRGAALRRLALMQGDG